VNTSIRISFIFAAVLFFAHGAAAFQRCETPPGFEWGEGVPQPCRVKLGTSKIEISGLASSLIFMSDGKKHFIKLPMHDHDRLMDLYLNQSANIYVILYEFGGSESSASAAAAFSVKDLKPIWHTPLAGFNLAGKQVGKDIYVSTIGYVARLDANTGKVAWQHKDLYVKGKFIGAGPISVLKEKVQFFDFEKRVIDVNMKTGEILK
jgi:outer membrane protein assembly factor BamB